LAAAAFALAGLPTTSDANAPLAFGARGFPVGYACYKESDVAWRCIPRPQQVPAADRCLPTDGGKFECFPPSARVTAKTKMPPMNLNCAQPEGSVSYVCYDVPVPSPPPPPPQAPSMPPPR
jgi:hypothetical protein